MKIIQETWSTNKNSSIQRLVQNTCQINSNFHNKVAIIPDILIPTSELEMMINSYLEVVLNHISKRLKDKRNYKIKKLRVDLHQIIQELLTKEAKEAQVREV